MASLLLTLDTTPPTAPSLSVVGGDGQVITTCADQVVLARLVCSATPADLLGEYKLWGDVDLTAYGAIQATEGASSWVTYSDPLVPIKLSAGAATKHLYGRLRDDLRNPTGVLAAQVIYDPTFPVVSVVTGPDRTRLSKQAGYRTCAFSWQCSVPFAQYMVRAVPATSSGSTAGSPIGTSYGSTGVAGAGTYAASTPMATSVDAADLEAAWAGDGTKVLKVFARDSSGRWSL